MTWSTKEDMKNSLSCVVAHCEQIKDSTFEEHEENSRNKTSVLSSVAPGALQDLELHKNDFAIYSKYANLFYDGNTFEFQHALNDAVTPSSKRQKLNSELTYDIGHVSPDEANMERKIETVTSADKLVYICSSSEARNPNCKDVQ